MRKINKKIIVLFIITLLISIVSYINYLPEYYSMDTNKIIKDGYLEYGTMYALQDGRIFSFVIFYISEIIDISIINLIQILFTCAIIISSISVLKLYKIINKCKNPSNNKIKVLIYLVVYCYIFNFMYIDSLEFAEGWIMAFSILFYIISAEKIILKNQNLKGIIYCFIGMLFYQGTLNMYITTAILFLLIAPKQSKKETIKKLAITGITTVFVLGIDFLIVDIIKSNVTVLQQERLHWDFIENFRTLKKHAPNLIINSLKIFPKYLQMSLIFIILVLIFIKNIQHKKPLNIIIPICLVLIGYLTSLGQSILTPTMLTSINGRIFISTGILISAILIYGYIKTDIFESKYIGKIIAILVISYFGINMINTIYVTGKLKEGNNIDRKISYEIQQVIEQYEEETNIEIKYIAVRYRNEMEQEKEWLRSKVMMRKYDADIYKIYTGEELEDKEFEIEMRVKHFTIGVKGIKCIDDVVYVYM